MHNFKELLVWQKSMELVKDVYLFTKKFPKDELFGLTQQIRRAVISIPSNIAEGAGRTTDADFSHFIDIALGSAYEVETQLYISLDLEYIFHDDFKNIIEKIQSIEKMIYNLKKSYQKTKLTTNDQRPNTNDQQLNTNEQRLNTNDQRPNTNK
ncbi:MAG: four helix bundle protein [Prevotellaceae bacterium]|jgi:four helix bundle protein|nr:four helix bundle protein [Prevotellaceae bacterium]